MQMPIDLILVRHGQSEGNIAINASKKGDDHFFDVPGFRERPGYDWRLSNHGRDQARLAGLWVREYFPKGFGRYYVSDFARAKETAALMDLPSAKWFLNIYLHEQLWGRFDSMPRSELEQRHPGIHAQRNRHRFYGTYPEGESMGEVCLRLDRIQETLGRECSDMAVILVCHGNVIRGFQLLIERISPRHFHEQESSDDPQYQVTNGMVVQYTRRDPVTGKLTEHYQWTRIIRPDDLHWKSDWREIRRTSYSNANLLREAEDIPRLIDG